MYLKSRTKFAANFPGFLIFLESASVFVFFFFNDTATTEIYTLSLHDALPIYRPRRKRVTTLRSSRIRAFSARRLSTARDRKSTRLNSSHSQISYAVFCLKKKTQRQISVCTSAVVCCSGFGWELFLCSPLSRQT